MNPERKKAINKLIKTEVMIRQVKKKSENFYKNKKLLDQLDQISGNFDQAFMVNKSSEKDFKNIDNFNKNFDPNKKESIMDISLYSPNLDWSRNIDIYDDSQYHPVGYKPDKSELYFNIFNGFDKVVDNIKKYCRYAFFIFIILVLVFSIYKFIIFLKNRKLLFFADKK